MEFFKYRLRLYTEGKSYVLNACLLNGEMTVVQPKKIKSSAFQHFFSPHLIFYPYFLVTKLSNFQAIFSEREHLQALRVVRAGVRANPWALAGERTSERRLATTLLPSRRTRGNRCSGAGSRSFACSSGSLKSRRRGNWLNG